MITGKKRLSLPPSPNTYSCEYSQASADFQTTLGMRQTSAGGGHCSFLRALTCWMNNSKFHRSLISFPYGVAGNADSFCQDSVYRCVTQPVSTRRDGKCHCAARSLKQQREWIGDTGEKNMSDPSRYLKNVSWLKWNALVRPSGGEFDIFFATCKIKRKCCWLLHCLLKGTGADRNVIKLPAAFICCHGSPCNEYNNNFIYTLA